MSRQQTLPLKATEPNVLWSKAMELKASVPLGSWQGHLIVMKLFEQNSP